MSYALTPLDIHPPFSAYNHGIEVPAGHRLVFCSGQLGIAPDGDVPSDAAAQAELCFDNIAATLAEAGMDLSHVIKLTAFVTSRDYLKAYMEVRNRRFPAPYPASTLLIISGFAREEFHVEVEAIAAAPGPTK